MFNGYFAEGAHLVDEKCAPYRGNTHGDSCKQYSKCNPVAKVTNSYFLEVSNTENKVNE